MLMNPRPVRPFRNAAPKKEANAIMSISVFISGPGWISGSQNIMRRGGEGKRD